MSEQPSGFIVSYIGLLLPAAVGYFWTDNWLYNKKEVTRHWLYVTALLFLMAVVAWVFRGGTPRGILFATLLPLPACAVGGVLGGIFGQFYAEKSKEEHRADRD